MKKFLFLVATATLFVACAEKDTLNEIREIPIDFTKSYIEKGTKAINTGLYTTANFETAGNTMGVYGWKKKSTTYTPIFSDQEVEFDNDDIKDGDWGYTPKKYWDSEADNYAFYAYAPHSSDFTGTVALTTAGDATTFSITNFTQATTVASQVDLMVDLTSQTANTTNKSTSNPREDVAFTFSHILTQVNILMAVSTELKADNTDNPVTVQSVSFNNVKIKGNYSYSNSAWAWSSQATPTTFNATQTNSVVFPSDNLTATPKNVPGLVEMLLIPGSITGYTITVNYTIGTTNPESFTKTINLSDFKNSSDETLAAWAIGYNYNYVLTIGPKPIEFDLTEVGTWGNGGTYEYVIE